MTNFEELSRKRAKKFFAVKNLKLPVDIEKIVSEYADIEEDFIPFDGDAICINGKDKPLIVLRKDVAESRKRFTLAHELGHIQIPWHTGLVSCHAEDGEKSDSRSYYQMEREANIFAAELLMPEDWLRSLVNSKEDQDIKELVSTICEKAQVSFSAALYNLINVLPRGYVFYILNKKENYDYKIVTGEGVRPVFLSTEEYCIDFKWILFNSYQSGIIEHDMLNVCWFKYKRILDNLIVEDCVKKLSEKYNLSNVLREIINRKDFSTAFSLGLLNDKLPSGYITKISFKPTGTYRYLVSKETYISPKWTSKENIDDWYKEYCQDLGSYEDERIKINWWYFKTAFDFQLSACTEDSKSILRNIIDNWYLESERRSIYGMVNGIIGSLNNHRKEMEPEQFYSILRQKFLGNKKLENVIIHKDFNQFLVKKTFELYGKQ